MSDRSASLSAVFEQLRWRQAVCDCHRVLLDHCPIKRGRSGEGFGLGWETRTDRRRLAGLIDHTLLRPEATRAQIETLCREGRENGFGAVCVNPCWVPICVERLRESATRVATVAGFPLGAAPPEIKAAEASRSVAEGASEIDMVLNLGALRSGDCQLVLEDIAGVVGASGRALVKVILETALLEDVEKTVACGLAQLAGADFVKTSTGFGPGGATVADVALMRRIVGPALGVKAAGGIRDWPSARSLLAAGADRIGTSAGVAILREAQAET